METTVDQPRPFVCGFWGAAGGGEGGATSLRIVPVSPSWSSELMCNVNGSVGTNGDKHTVLLKCQADFTT